MRKRCFTLIEVVVAIVILSLGIFTALLMTSTSTNRISKSYKRWHNQHMISQAAEYILLEGPDKQIPEDIFPFDGYSVHVSELSPEGLPDNIDPVNGQAELKLIRIELISPEGKIVETLNIEKIIRNSL